MFPLPLSRVSRRSTNVGVLLLLMQICQTGFCRIPPITMGVILLNSAMYLGLVHPLLQKRYPEAIEVCVGIQQVWRLGEYWRLVEASFYHGDDLHLYFNMISFLWKGMTLECRMGSLRFLFLIAVLSVSVNVLMLYLNYLIAHFLAFESYMSRCAIGFSGVVFALKVLTTYLAPHTTCRFLGCIPVSGRVSFWFELVLIQFLIPNASLTGHLSGILLGLAFTQEPLKRLLCCEFSAVCDSDSKCANDLCCPVGSDCPSSESDCNSNTCGNACEISDDDCCNPVGFGLYDESNFSPFVSQGYNFSPPPVQTEDDPEPTSGIQDSIAAEEMRRRRMERFEPNR